MILGTFSGLQQGSVVLQAELPQTTLNNSCPHFDGRSQLRAHIWMELMPSPIPLKSSSCCHLQSSPPAAPHC